MQTLNLAPLNLRNLSKGDVILIQATVEAPRDEDGDVLISATEGQNQYLSAERGYVGVIISKGIVVGEKVRCRVTKRVGKLVYKNDQQAAVEFDDLGLRAVKLSNLTRA